MLSNQLFMVHISLAVMTLGVGKALVGAIVKPVVGVGDAAVVVMNHVGDAASEKIIVVKGTKRMRRALPQNPESSGISVKLIPFDALSAKA
jgi:Asp/Glu/hydantoin racemase